MATSPDPVHWVLGSHGLLGSAVVRRLTRARATVRTTAVPWDDPDAAAAVFGAELRLLLRDHARVRVLWCAGAGIVGTGPEALALERAVLSALADRLVEQLPDHGPPAASLLLSSSAGGVYAGSRDALITERTTPRPLAPYGESKLAAEHVVTDLAGRTGMPVLLARIANLYGPGQDLAKPQGLISQLCRAQVQRRPLMMYVPLDTARDYVYVDDAAAQLLAALAAAEQAPGPVVKIIGSGRATTLASVIGELHRLTKRRPPIVLGASPNSRAQATDLRFRSVVLPEVDRHARTPLSAGIQATFEDVASRLRRPA